MPGKDENLRVAWPRGVLVSVVSNSEVRRPTHPVREGVVTGAFDLANDWIAEAADEYGEADR